MAKSGKWLAQISKEGQCKSRGCLDDKIAAIAEAYDGGASALFGEARLNVSAGIDAWLESRGASDRAACGMSDGTPVNLT